MSEDLEIKVKADTGEAVANLGKAEKAVDGVKKKTQELDAAGKKAGESVGQAVSKQVSSFTQLAEGLGKVTMIFGAAVAAGKALAAGIDAISASLDKAAKAEGEAIDRKIKFDKALRLASDGVIALGHSTDEMLGNYDAYVEKMRAARAGTDEQTEALKRQKQAFDELAAGLPDLQKRTNFTILSPEDADKQLDGIRSLAKGLEDVLGKAFAAGGEEERAAWAEANREAVDKVIEYYRKAGQEIPPNLKAIDAARKDDTAAVNEWAAAQAAAYDRVAEATQRQRAAEDAARNRTSKAPDEFRQIQFEAIGAAAAMGELGTNLDRVAETVVATGGTMTVGAPYFIQYAQATREATQALLDFAVASKAVREEQAQAMEVTKGWTDYILTLKDGYESGVTSLYNYVTALNAFKSQLLQMFSAASGPAKDALEGMIALIEKLVQTAGATPGGRYQSGPVAELEKAFRDAKGNG